MSQDMNLKVIVIDDNTEFHEDFIKILMRNKQSEADTLITEMDKELFGSNQSAGWSLLPPARTMHDSV